MPKGVVGTMDTVGFVEEPTLKIDRAVKYYFANRIDQSIILRDIHSYQYIVAKHQDDKDSEEAFLEDIKRDFTAYLLQIFDSVSVAAHAIRKAPEDKMFTLALSGKVTQDGKQHDVAHAVYLEGSSFKIIDQARALNNGS